MSDNVVQFPRKPKLELVFTPEDDLEDDVDAAHSALICNLNGMHVTADVPYASLMEACLLAAANCAKQAGLTADEFNKIMHSIEVTDED